MSRSSISLEGLKLKVPVGVADREASGEADAEGGGSVEEEEREPRDIPEAEREELVAINGG